MKAGIKIQPKKTKIFQTETEYLGHKVSQGGVQMLDQYVKDIQNWPRPTSCKEMSSFLGFTGYYRGFIPKYSALTNRMNSLKKAEKFVWTEDMEKDFLELKAEFSAGRIQAYPDFDSDEPFILTTDWSSLNIAAQVTILRKIRRNSQESFTGKSGENVDSFPRNFSQPIPRNQVQGISCNPFRVNSHNSIQGIS